MMSISRFKLVTFDFACKKLEQLEYFMLVFKRLDDEADIYATFLEQNPEIANEFITPDHRYHLLLVEKTPYSKKILLDYPRNVNAGLLIHRNKWDDLFLVAFNGQGGIFQKCYDVDDRLRVVSFFKDNHSKVLKGLLSKFNRNFK